MKLAISHKICNDASMDRITEKFFVLVLDSMSVLKDRSQSSRRFYKQQVLL
ncbi:hypothetical protein Smp_099100 [Schistosoma mansoni]|uniref:hypothetical protein n=1 Tax=Schistosoma mansoni TaxID=6183 RepID=UPI00022DC9A8|nr:hypothetical protein Smp_099100 [Schistosoma mansoni]|eukprot:XP_018655241.1 hypothetical protein Smp_099100 [Schistosoma mansoni]